MKKAEAQLTCGTMSQTSKMGCQSYGLPIASCNVGSKLRMVAGSTCADCYADKGAYRQYAYTVLPAQERRLNAIKRATSGIDAAWQWVHGMVALIGKDSHFRWHDAGDLISLAHLELIAQVAVEMPSTKFWLPSREKAIILAYLRKHGAFPENLCVRLSATMIDEKPLDIGVNGSAVYTVTPIGLACIAPKQGGKCGTCMACWDKSVPVVSYHKH